MFVIQSERLKGNDIPMFDFGYELVHSIECSNYFYGNGSDRHIEYRLSDIESNLKTDNASDCTPVGSIEFVKKWIETNFNVNSDSVMRPLNVPDGLLDYNGFSAYNSYISDIDFNDGSEYYLKSNSSIKNPFNGRYDNMDDALKSFGKDEYVQYRKIIPNIVSEYRCFVYMDKLIDIKNYMGDFRVFPDCEEIDRIIRGYKWDFGYGPAPKAYTLDIGILNDGRILIIECHEFYSCGLYGFRNEIKLPQMLIAGYSSIYKRIKNNKCFHCFEEDELKLDDSYKKYLNPIPDNFNILHLNINNK